MLYIYIGPGADTEVVDQEATERRLPRGILECIHDCVKFERFGVEIFVLHEKLIQTESS